MLGFLTKSDLDLLRQLKRNNGWDLSDFDLENIETSHKVFALKEKNKIISKINFYQDEISISNTRKNIYWLSGPLSDKKFKHLGFFPIMEIARKNKEILCVLGRYHNKYDLLLEKLNFKKIDINNYFIVGNIFKTFSSSNLIIDSIFNNKRRQIKYRWFPVDKKQYIEKTNEIWHLLDKSSLITTPRDSNYLLKRFYELRGKNFIFIVNKSPKGKVESTAILAVKLIKIFNLKIPYICVVDLISYNHTKKRSFKSLIKYLGRYSIGNSFLTGIDMQIAKNFMAYSIKKYHYHYKNVEFDHLSIPKFNFCYLDCDGPGKTI